MAIEYRLTLAGDISLEQVADLAAPEVTEKQPVSGHGRLLSADLSQDYGYSVSIRAGSQGYYDAEDDDGSQWEWEPDAYVNVTFRMRKDVATHDGVRNMVAAVARVLAGRAEDAALVLNGNWLLLTRVDGVLRQHRSTWWNNYGVEDLLSH